MIHLFAGAWAIGPSTTLTILIVIGALAMAGLILRLLIIYIYYRIRNNHTEATDQISRRFFH